MYYRLFEAWLVLGFLCLCSVSLVLVLSLCAQVFSRPEQQHLLFVHNLAFEAWDILS